MKSARKENKFSNLIELFQNLADEENRQKVETTISFVRQKEAENEPNRKNKKNEEDKKKKNKYSRCDRSSHSKEKCPAVNFECTNVIKSVIEGLCAEPKRRIKTISQKRNHLRKNRTYHSPHQGSH